MLRLSSRLSLTVYTQVTLPDRRWRLAGKVVVAVKIQFF